MADFDEINVQRINLREPDGRLRCVLSNSARLPGAIIRGEEVPHPRNVAGMVFYNDEETENGGLGFAGAKGESVGHLTFDAYEQDEVVALSARTKDGKLQGGLFVSERPPTPIGDTLATVAEVRKRPDAEETLASMEAAGEFGHNRVFVGVQDGAATVSLKDGAGRTRLRLAVADDGTPSIQFLDSDGTVVREL